MQFGKLKGLPQHPEDLRLASRVLSGDERAIQEFMDVYFPRLFRFALSRMNRDELAAEDVVQQTITIAARRIETYRGEASLMTWLSQICRRELGRYAKQEQARNTIITLVDDDPLATAILESLQSGEPDQPLMFSEQSELKSLVHVVLDQLPNRQGDVLEWKYIDGLSVKEIATRMNLGPEAVQSLLARAKKSFKQLFNVLYELHHGDTGRAHE